MKPQTRTALSVASGLYLVGLVPAFWQLSLVDANVLLALAVLPLVFLLWVLASWLVRRGEVEAVAWLRAQQGRDKADAVRAKELTR